MKFQKKPVVIEAVQLTASAFDGSHPNPEHLAGVGYHPVERWATIWTPGGPKRAEIGDWIICDAKGGKSVCKADLFAMLYDLAED